MSSGRAEALHFRGPCFDTGLRVSGGTVHIGYFDEFGHNGAYVSRGHAQYKTHPVFGIGGFIIPADSVRELSGFYRHLKETGLREEIEAKVIPQGKKVEHWEKKGAALLTTKNVTRYREVRRMIGRLLRKLGELEAQVVFYGQEKPRGGPDRNVESNAERYDHAMKQLIQRIHWNLPDHESFMLILDKQGDRERLEVFAGTAAFMFSHRDGARLLEPPMEVESHLYQTVQCADWICGLLGRITAYKYDPDFSEFQWAVKYFGAELESVTSNRSKIRSSGSGKNLYPRYLSNLGTCFDTTQVPASQASLESLRSKYSDR